MGSRSLLTIGYGSRSLDALILLLEKYDVKYLIDVRSSPYSRFKPEYSQKPLRQRLKEAGIKYVFMGDSLGGRPDDESCYVDGHVDYALVSKREFYNAGLTRLRRAWRLDTGAALMCSEEKPENCHRSKLIGRSLTSEGILVQHIDENGEIKSQDAIISRITQGQLGLFDEPFRSRKKYRSEPGHNTQFGTF